MDPDETLKNLRECATALYSPETPDDDRVDIALTMVDNFQALDEWLLAGGFVPTAWAKTIVILTESEKAANR